MPRPPPRSGSIPNFLVDCAAVAGAARSTARECFALYAQRANAARKAHGNPVTENPNAPSPPGKSAQGRAEAEQHPVETRTETAAAGKSAAQEAREFSISLDPDNDHAVHKAAEAGPEHPIVGSKSANRPSDVPYTRPPAFNDVPPGIDVNVFRTGKMGGASDALASLAKRARQPPPPREVRYPAPWADLKSSANPGNQASCEGPLGKLSESAPEEAGSAASHPIQGTAPSDESAVPPNHSEVTVATPAQEPTTKPETITPTIADDVAQPNPLQGRAYELRESKVPATRMGRLWNYGGLAAGMLGGALTESLTRAVGGGGGSSQGSVMLSPANMERLVSKLSRMRGAALKMGQMMSFQDAKMLPGPIHEVLQRVQDRADYMPSYQRDKVLTANLGPNWRDLFEEFEEKPIAAASIGQVHKAKLRSNGQPVAVKIQFPGVADSINSDLDNLGVLLTATKLLPKGLYLDKTIANARTELGWECDYEREAACLTRFGALMADETAVFRVPRVHAEASGRQVLTMDFMEGAAVTRIATFTQAQRDWIGTQILRLCLREITEFRFMQTDPNWTNFLYNAASGRLELLDFGASREFPAEFVDQYVRLLEAASRTDRGAVKALSEELGYLTGLESRAMLDAHVGSVLTLAEPFLGSAPEVYDFRDQTITERVKGFIPVMLKERLAPPPEETYSLHRKLSGAFLLCARLGSRVRCRELFQASLEKGGFVSKT